MMKFMKMVMITMVKILVLILLLVHWSLLVVYILVIQAKQESLYWMMNVSRIIEALIIINNVQK